MKKQIILMSMLLVAISLLFSTGGCKKKTEVAVFEVSTIMAGDIDLNGATSPTNVPVNLTIVATFSTAVNSGSVTGAVTLVRDFDTANVDITVTVSGSSITIVPNKDLTGGSLYALNFSSAITSTDGQNLAGFKRTFTTIGTFVPDGMVACYTFENTAADVLNHYNPKVGGVIDLTYATSFAPAAGMAAKFNGSTTLIEIPNGDSLMNTNDFSISLWVRADTTKHGQFVLGLAGWYGFQYEMGQDYSWTKLAAQYRTGPSSSASQDLFFNGKEKLSDWKGYTFCKDLTTSGGVNFLIAAKWVNVVCRFNSATKVATMYINGDKMKEQDYNLYDPPMTQAEGLKYNGNPGNNTFVFGFIQDKNDPTIPDAWANYDDPANEHFKGLLDNVRIFHKWLTEKEIQMMYDSEKP